MSTWTSGTVTQIRNHLNFTWDDKAKIESALTDYESLYTATAVTEMMSNLTQLDTYKTAIDTERAKNKDALSAINTFRRIDLQFQEGVDHQSGSVGLYNELRAKIQRELELVGLRSNRVSVSRVVRG
jgi:hypothetical protein